VLSISLTVRRSAVIPAEGRRISSGGPRAGIHMWTAPACKRVWQRAHRIACDHMSGLLMAVHMTACQDGLRDASSKQ